MQAFENAFKAACDFHTHMHTEDECNFAKTVEALKPVTAAFNALADATCDHATNRYFEEIDGYYGNLEYGLLEVKPT